MAIPEGLDRPVVDQVIVSKNNIASLHEALKTMQKRIDELENEVNGLKRTIVIKDQENQQMRQSFNLAMAKLSMINGSSTS